ncbi:MAG: YbhN family protein [Pirellulales bacterium]
MSKPPETSTDENQGKISGNSAESLSQLSYASDDASPQRPNWGFVGEFAKYSGMIAIFVIAIIVLRKKLGDITLDKVLEGLQTIPPYQIGLALLITGINFVVLTGYDLIAVRFLKKPLPLLKIMQGAVIGYALSNVFGWLLGGNAVRYRLYTGFGFRFVEVVAFVSILSVTFWLGMFLLAGIAFVMLPVRLPEDYGEKLHFPLYVYGYLFLVCVMAYLIATIVIRKPIRVGKESFPFPPFRMSLLQLAVSACDFLLAALVLYVLLPPEAFQAPNVNYSTVLVSYLAAMVIVVATHMPGGFGVLEAVVISLLVDETAQDADGVKSLKNAVVCGLILFRVIYYLLPAVVAGIMFFMLEVRMKKPRAAAPAPSLANESADMDPEI